MSEEERKEKLKKIISVNEKSTDNVKIKKRLKKKTFQRESKFEYDDVRRR